MARSAAQVFRRLATHGVLGISIIVVVVFALAGIGFAAGWGSEPGSAPLPVTPAASTHSPAPPDLRWMQAHRADVRWMQDHWAQWQWMRAHMGDIAWMHNHWGGWNSWRSGMMSGGGGHQHRGNGWCEWGC